MKKLLCITLAAVMCMSFAACQEGGTTPVPTTDAETTQTNPPQTTEPTPSKTPEPTSGYRSVTLTEKIKTEGFIRQKISPNILVVDMFVHFDVSNWIYSDNSYLDVHVIVDNFDEWCKGDQLDLTFDKVEYPYNENDPVIIHPDVIKEGHIMVDKPIIYLYPELPTEVSLRVSLNGKLTCTYPDHGMNGWQGFTAYPDGTLIFPDGKEYYALYWEGEQNVKWDFSKGFCVRGEDTAEFLEWALAKQGLNSREANEFIIYWLPLMQDNPYNVISFQTTVYTDNAHLEIDPAPDSMLRVFMAYYPTDTEVEITPQSFEGFVRDGFTVVEWGGSKVSQP